MVQVLFGVYYTFSRRLQQVSPNPNPHPNPYPYPYPYP